MRFDEIECEIEAGHGAAESGAGQQDHLAVPAGAQSLAEAGRKLFIGGANGIGGGVGLLAIEAEDEIGIELLDQFGAPGRLGSFERGDGGGLGKTEIGEST